ncbi:MAG: NERD domain-containing protein, partial [Betaproteobacteria bacterium]
MIAKPADDSSSRLRILEALLDSPRLDVQQKRQLAEYIDRKKIGLNGERQAAHFIDSYLATRDNHQVIHDLRIEADGDTAQIDHLIIGRGFHLFLLETKNFGGDVNINDRGEFSVRYGHKVYGIPSPIEQSRRHEIVLLKVLERIGISGRLASKPKVFHAVLLHPRATITRPASDRFDSSCVIKADQFEEWRLKKIDDVSVAGMLGMIANIVSTQTIAEWARALVAEHQPENPLALPEWLAPRELPAPVKALRA